jgi:hypothetical protein
LRAVLMIRQAISPRVAIRMRLNMCPYPIPASGFAALQQKCQSERPLVSRLSYCQTTVPSPLTTQRD